MLWPLEFYLILFYIPRLGCINVHGSLLPRWRGAAPIQHSLINGDKKTGLTAITLAEGIINNTSKRDSN